MKVLVCGSQYGVYYADAVVGLQGLHLAGLMARGSPRSEWLAEQCGVPLFRSVEEMTGDIDLACVAVGGEAGEALGLRLLERGCHVLQEHPLTPAFLARALELAEVRRVCFHVNGHFSDLPAPRAFLREVASARAANAVTFGTVTGSERSLYSLLDILGLALGSLDVDEVVVSPARSFGARSPLTVSLLLAGVPFTFVLQQSGEVDDGSDSVVGHRITLVFPRADLLLVGPHGPVVSSEQHGDDSALPVWKDLGPPPAPTDAVAEIRVEANQRALEQLIARARGGPIPAGQTRKHLMGVADAHQAIWDRVLEHWPSP